MNAPDFQGVALDTVSAALLSSVLTSTLTSNSAPLRGVLPGRSLPNLGSAYLKRLQQGPEPRRLYEQQGLPVDHCWGMESRSIRLRKVAKRPWYWCAVGRSRFSPRSSL